MRAGESAPGEKKTGKSTAVCPVCMHHCQLEEGQCGRCRARKARDGRVVSVSYGQVTALMLDPDIPLHITRFFPGYRMRDRDATDVERIYALRERAAAYLRHVYTGNC